MLSRRLTTSSLTSLRTTTTATTFAPISYSILRFASNNKGSNEDADEIAREQKLREMFASKQAPKAGNGGLWDQFKQVHHQAKEFAAEKAAEAARKRAGGAAAPSSSSGNNNQVENTTSTTTNNNTSGRPPVPSWFGPSQSFWTFMVYVTATYSLFLVWQLSDDQSFISLTQGVPHWANAPYDVAAYMLFRTIFSFADQRRIQKEFEAIAPAAPNSSFFEFLTQRYGYAQLSGNTASFQETVALVAAALRQDFANNTRVIGQAASKAGRDNRDKIEAIANTLRTAGIRPLILNTNTNNNNYFGGGYYNNNSMMNMNMMNQQQQHQSPMYFQGGGYQQQQQQQQPINLSFQTGFQPLNSLPPQLVAQLQQQARGGGGTTTLTPQQQQALGLSFGSSQPQQQMMPPPQQQNSSLSEKNEQEPVAPPSVDGGATENPKSQ